MFAITTSVTSFYKFSVFPTRGRRHVCNYDKCDDFLQVFSFPDERSAARLQVRQV